jgi:regulator of replication initiation timing
MSTKSLKDFQMDLEMKYHRRVQEYKTDKLVMSVEFLPLEKMTGEYRDKAIHAARRMESLKNKVVKTVNQISDQVTSMEVDIEKYKVNKFRDDIKKQMMELGLIFDKKLLESNNRLENLKMLISSLKAENIRLKTENSSLRKSEESDVVELEGLHKIWQEAEVKCGHISTPGRNVFKIHENIDYQQQLFSYKILKKDLSKFSFDPGTTEEVISTMLFVCHFLALGMITTAQEVANKLVESLNRLRCQETMFIYLLFKHGLLREFINIKV